MRVAILPSGALLVDTAPGDDDASDGLSVAARSRIARAFARGPGHALLDLGATELDAPLPPPLAFLRDVGRAFVTRLCAVPDLEERRERVEVDCPPDERLRLAGAVPPMDGGEYGVGIRLDAKPELFFLLRQVDQAELLSSATAGAVSRARPVAGKRIASDRLSEVFGIELEDAAPGRAGRAGDRSRRGKRRTGRQ